MGHLPHGSQLGDLPAVPRAGPVRGPLRAVRVGWVAVARGGAGRSVPRMTLRTVDDDLEDPGLARLFSLARERLEALGGVRGRVCVPELSPAEALAIDTLWRRTARKRPRRGQDFSCSLSDLDASLRAMLG